MTPKTSTAAAMSSPGASTERPRHDSSKSPRLHERFKSLVALWLRRPQYEVAEAVIRLRKHRGLSQQELAEKIGTKQPAVARIEAGLANVRLDTLVRLAEGLNATVRIDMMPMELVGAVPQPARWWRSVSGPEASIVLNRFDISPRGIHVMIGSESAYPMLRNAKDVVSADVTAPVTGGGLRSLLTR